MEMNRSFSRRGFLCVAGGVVFSGCYHFGDTSAEKPLFRIGLVTDVHYADIDPDPAELGVIGRRFYRESLRKFSEAISLFNERKLDFAIELGDFKDFTRNHDETLRHLRIIEGEFAKFRGPRYHVAGNHDFDCLSAEEFFGEIPNDGRICLKGYYSFVRGGITFIVMNASFDSQMRPYSNNNPWDDANVPPEEIEWLRHELSAAKGDVIVFCHQRLDDSAEKRHLVKNADEVRSVLEQSGKVKAVITGHQHKGGLNIVNGIVYYSLRALVCGTGEGQNSFAELQIFPSGKIAIIGWYNALSFEAEGNLPESGKLLDVGDIQNLDGKNIESLSAGNGERVAMVVASVKEGTFDITRRVLAKFPREGKFLCLRSESTALAVKLAKLLQGEKCLGNVVISVPNQGNLVLLKAKCPWVKTTLIAKDVDAVDSAVNLGAQFLEISTKFPLSDKQRQTLQDHAIRVICFDGNIGDFVI